MVQKSPLPSSSPSGDRRTLPIGAATVARSSTSAPTTIITADPSGMPTRFLATTLMIAARTRRRATLACGPGRCWNGFMVPKVLIAMVVAVVVGLGASPAAAGKDAFVRFVADLAASSDAAAAWFADCDVLLTPGGQVRRPCALTMADLAGGAAGATLKVTSNKVAHLYASQYLAREATVEARVGRKLVATFRVVEISGFGNPDNPTGGWAPLAVHGVSPFGSP